MSVSVLVCVCISVPVWVWSDWRDISIYPDLCFSLLFISSVAPVLTHTFCVCVCVAGLRHNINQRRWLLWNLITLIICTGRPDSPFHASALLVSVHQCVWVVVRALLLRGTQVSWRVSHFSLNKHRWFTNKWPWMLKGVFITASKAVLTF